MSVYKTCSISVNPKVTLYDEKVHIKVQGLIKHSKVTLQAWTYSEWRRKEVLFLSYGHFYADQHGEVDLDRSPSVGGTYTDVDPMGLFWSLKPLPDDPQNVRSVVKDVEKPIEVKLAVFSGHITSTRQTVAMESVSPLCQTVVIRSAKAVDVKRIEIEDGRIRGTLFLPPGIGPHPGVIDLFGAAGGIMEIRASLLAAHGFAALSLAFFRYKDLPGSESDVQVDYFEEAINWLSTHPAVKPGGIGMVGASSGGTVSLLLTTLCPQVRAVVNINGPPFRMVNDLHRHGKLLVRATPPDPSTLIVTEEGPISRTAFKCSMNNVLPTWKSSAHILCITCTDDKSVEPDWLLKLKSYYPVDKQHLIDVIIYPGAGHLLEPPYTPICRMCKSTMHEHDIFWGGIPKPHAVAQMDAWHRTIDFLHAVLGDKTSQVTSKL